MINKGGIGKDLEGSDHGLIEVLSQHFPGKTEESRKRPQDSRVPGRDSNRKPTEYKSRPLHLFGFFM
jgi:hypothetical protein